MNYRKVDKMILKYIILIALFILVITHMNQLSVLLKWIWSGISNIVYAIMVAYVMNIILVRVEKTIDRFIPKLKFSLKRPLSIVVTFLIVVIIIYTLVSLIIPEIINASKVLAESIPVYASYIQDFLGDVFKDFPSIVTYIENTQIDWKEFVNKAVSFFTTGVTNIFYTSLNFLTVITSSVINVVMIMVLSIYLLLDKERFIRFFKRLENIYLKEQYSQSLNMALDVTHQSFTNFISGQCIEAIVIGILCAIGMAVLKLPYALMVGTIVGATSLIPVFGAYFGGALSVFIVFTVSAKSAVVFLIFLVVLQQLESNLIYPRIVGTSVGLPGVLVIMAVMVFGTLFGVAGMFLGVPVFASLYKLMNIYLNYKETMEK